MSIAHLLRYFWGGALGIAPLVLVTACAFDFYDISKSALQRKRACIRSPDQFTDADPFINPTGFLLHHWDGKALDGLRLAFCSEGAEAGGKCAAPVLVPGGPGFQNITVRGWASVVCHCKGLLA